MAATTIKNIGKLLLKVAVTGLCLWYVSKKIDWTLTFDLLQKSNKWWLLFALVFFILSKVVSSFRLNIYFRNVQVYLTEINNLRLYWLGMFYNLFLPGGIGGDAYKVMVLNKKTKQPIKKLSAAVLLDRISGVAGLGVIAAVYYYLIYRGHQYSYVVIGAIVPALIAYYFLVKKLFPSFVTSFSSTLLLGIAVQLLQVICVYGIIASIGVAANTNEFIFLFLLSSIVAIFPFTIGGLGAREVVFLWGGEQFMLDTHQSIYISILFYLVTVVASLAGIRWVYKDPVQE
jgi:glycosyltransferase 2 family protein